MIKSIVYSDEEAILSMLKLHASGQDIELDPTYSTGGFYNKTTVNKPKYKFDITPQSPGVIAADAANLPLADSSIGVTIFDPGLGFNLCVSFRADKRRGSNPLYIGVCAD